MSRLRIYLSGVALFLLLVVFLAWAVPVYVDWYAWRNTKAEMDRAVYIAERLRGSEIYLEYLKAKQP